LGLACDFLTRLERQDEKKDQYEIENVTTAHVVRDLETYLVPGALPTSKVGCP
jgi:hypothetical protein